MKYLLFFIISLLSLNTNAYYDIIHPTPNGFVRFYSPIYQGMATERTLAQVNGPDCYGSSSESCYSCQNSVLTVVYNNPRHEGRCFKCADGANYHDNDGNQIPPLSKPFPFFTCYAPPSCPEEYTLQENSPYFGGKATCAKPMPCSENYTYIYDDKNPKNSECKRNPCPQGSYLAPTDACIPLPECTVNEEYQYNNGYFTCKLKTCPLGQILENGVCKVTCKADEFELVGQCFKKCKKTEKFINGQCEKDNDIIDAINRLNESVTNKTNDINQDSDSLMFDILSILEDITNTLTQLLDSDQNNNQNIPQEQINISDLDAETPQNQINILEYIDQNIFTTNASCPADRQLNIWANVYTFEFSKLCYWLSLLSKLILAIALYFSINILLEEN
jgi:hypothetical protein